MATINICIAITAKNTNCPYKAKFGSYCGKHKNKQIATQSTAAPIMTAFEQELLKHKELKRISQEQIEKEKAEIERKRVENMEQIEKEKVENKMKHQERKLEALREIEREKMDLAVQLKQMDLAQSDKRMDFEREENNKNRLLTMITTNHIDKIDLIAYGTNSKQLLCSKSAQEVIEYSLFDESNEYDSANKQIISKAIEDVQTEETIYEGDTMRSIDAIDFEKFDLVMKELEQTIHSKRSLIAFNKVKEQVNQIKLAIKDHKIRMKRTTLDECIAYQDTTKYSTMKPKIFYLRAQNNLRQADDNEPVINCYCCDQEITLNGGETHRCHNIPKSKGGDCSKDNIYLCCASCNQAMGDGMTVLEYKTMIYNKSHKN